MRIAIFSDVHGNLSSLEAVLADIERHKPDQVIFAGDLCYLGARPAECLQLVRDRRILSVVGNTDEWLTGQAEPPEPRKPTVDWARACLSADEREWLNRLPLAVRISPTPRAAEDLLIVHANPRNVDDIIFPDTDTQIARYGEVRQSDVDLTPLLDSVEAGVIAYGHLHVPGIRQWRSLTLVNISSVNIPGDGDGRAKYALLEWRANRWKVTHHRVAYDATTEAAAFRTARPPDWEQIVASLDTQGYYYPQQI